MPAEFAILSLLLAAYALVAVRLERFSIGPAFAFTVIGLVAAQDAIGLISIEPTAEPVRILAEGALALLLFADASEIRSRALRHDLTTILRLLLIGLLLTIVLGTAAALIVFPGISIGIALLIGSSLAPTDAALGQPVVTNPNVPARVRRLLNVESGLNDGIATPFVFVALGLAAAEAQGSSAWLSEAAIDFSIGAATGLVLGFTGGRLLEAATLKGWTSRSSRQLFVLALAVGCYLASISLGGNGFIAAFIGGLAFGAGSKQLEARAVRFTETQGSLLAIGVWAAFGLFLAGELGGDLWSVNAIVFAALALTVLRMAPVALALFGTRLNRVTVLFMGWFGPRGLASIVFLIIGIEGLHEVGVDPGPTAAAVAWTVLGSVVLHGLTAGPFAERYGRFVSTLPADAPELADAVEPPPHRVTWSVGRHSADA
jgi:sodium/hydrogen antiporter